MANLNNSVFTLNKYTEYVLDEAIAIFEPRYGWWAGGQPSNTTLIDRVSFRNDTVTASSRGTLRSGASGGSYCTGVTGHLDAWFHVGGGPASAGGKTSIDRLIFASDVGGTSVRSPISAGRFYNTGFQNADTDGYYAAGYSGVVALSLVDRIIFASDSTTGVAKGNLDRSTYYVAGAESPSSGYIGGGAPSPAPLSSVSKIIFASDTATAVAKGPLADGKAFPGAESNTTDAWFGGGYNKTSVSRIIFASDTATAVAKGPLTGNSYGSNGSGNTTDAWINRGAGNTGVSRIIFATDTAAATARGGLNVIHAYGGSN